MDRPLLCGSGPRGCSGSGSCSRCCSRFWSRCGWVQSWLPVLTWLPRYRFHWLKMDLLAGLTVGLTTVPQALAYAEVVGLPVQFGLYSSFVGGLVYFLLGTSKDVTLGPTAIMSLLCCPLVEGSPVRAALLCLLCGALQTAMALGRLGFLLDFISYPVIKGFTCAAAVTIGFSQVKNLLGLHGVRQQFFLQLVDYVSSLSSARLGDVVLGGSSLLLLLLLSYMKTSLSSLQQEEETQQEETPTCTSSARRLVWAVATMRNALVVCAATLFSFSCEALGLRLFTVTGATAQGLPPFSPPSTSLSVNGTIVPFTRLLQDFGGGLVLVPFMGVLESVAIAKSFASQNNYRINANQELLAIGVTNVLGSFVSAFPVTGSFGRTAVNSQTGVCSPAGGIVTSVIVLLSLAFLMPAFSFIPKASLAAVVITAVAPLFDIGVIRKMWRIYKPDLVPFSVTFLLSFWEIQFGILGGVGVSAVMLFYSAARPRLTLSEQHLLVVKLGSGLSFPAAEHLSSVLHSKALQASPPLSVVLDCLHVSVIDYSVICELKDIMKTFRLRGNKIYFSRLQPSILSILLSADLPDFRYFETVEEALQEGAEPKDDCRLH